MFPRLSFEPAIIHDWPCGPCQIMPLVPFSQCPYMGLSLRLLAIAVLVWTLWSTHGQPRRDFRWLMLVGGLTCGPYGLFSFGYIPKYWKPVLTTWFGPA